MNIVLSTFLCTVFCFCNVASLREGGTQVCRQYYYTKDKYYKSCGLFGWWGCTAYREKLKYYLKCCSGYSNGNYWSDCPYAICDGKINAPHISRKACTINYKDDSIIHRNGVEERNSGGRCVNPDECGHCNPGFYVDGPYCRICPPIPHCKFRKCTEVKDNHCEYCDGEIIDEKKKFWRAYIRSTADQFKTCVQACSWRKDSTRCYPGVCSDDTAASCKCIDGFGGKQCDTIVNDTTISYATAKLRNVDDVSDPIETPVDPNDPIPKEIKWTNNQRIGRADLRVTGVFRSRDTPPAPDLLGQTHFVTEFRYGITRGEQRLTLNRENTTIMPIVVPCNVNVKNGLPTPEIYDCKSATLYFQQDCGGFLPFQHNDQVIYSFEIANGGYLKYIDRDTHKEASISTPTSTVHFKGRSVVRNFIFQWDLIPPEHTCVKNNGLNCNVPLVYTKDITKNSTIKLEWNGWIDELSKIGSYAYEVYDLGTDGTALSEDKKITGKTNIHESTKEVSFEVKTIGMYSVIFTAVDKAGNEKSARTFFFYDNAANVELNGGYAVMVAESTKETNHVWVNVDTPMLHIVWPGRFRNYVHHSHLWLTKIRPRKHIDIEYDDHYGRRTADSIPNVQGVVRFETKFNVLSPNVSQQVNFTVTSNVLDESTNLLVRWSDGDRLDVTVRAFDLFDEYAEDNVTVYKDVSPPEIENLWLSRGDIENISVHSVEDFSKMTIEWDAYDYHSGIDNLQWRLYDNFTKTDIIHGHDVLRSQGDTANLTECEEKYGTAQRGPQCYCTNFHGCYHKHFYIKPNINNNSGLIVGKDKGVHDSDYYLEVTVVNKALLKTVFTKKITIDVSPPHDGSVHDGIRGEPEVDYQQDLHLSAYWEGFFDRESGVEFYQYIFSDHCFTNEEFRNSSEIQKTYYTFASYDAPNEGIYFISVVAVNRAMDKTNVVCSDGTTVTTTVPYITDFVLEGARTQSRVVKDNNGSLWLLDNNLQRHMIENSSAVCRTVQTEDISVFPIANDVKFARGMCTSDPSIHILAVLSKSTQFKMTWSSGINRTFVHDFEVGLSTTASGIAPDILPYISSKHHTHFRINHPDIHVGKEFYVNVKSVSKSGIEGIQNIGPFILDTTKPQFIGRQIDVRFESGFLIANWSSSAFTDPDNPYTFKFQYALGHKGHLYDVQSFRNLQSGGTCKLTSPPTCTAVRISQLKWSLHGHHTYFFTVKATNLAGLSVTQPSVGYIHDIQLPSKGTVMDINPIKNETKYPQDIEDVDFTTERTSLAISWSEFLHPHQEILFSACVGTTAYACDVVSMKELNTSDNNFIFINLSLQPFQKYFSTVEASTTAGNITVCSDGVRVLDISKNLTGVIVRDGTNCSSQQDMKLSHHVQDTRPKCRTDINYQTSTTSMDIYWDVPREYNGYIREAFVKLEERVVHDMWVEFEDFFYVGNHQYTTINNLDLEPGKTYRAAVKFCSEDLCFPPVSGNGVTILTNPPKTGDLMVTLTNTTQSDQKLIVTFEPMRDPDVIDSAEAGEAISIYEWAIGDNVGIHTKWNEVENISSTIDHHIQFSIALNKSLDFSKCRKIYVRGYNKAGVWAVTSQEIQQCKIDDGNSLILPNVVMDAVGEQEYNIDGTKRDGYGREIFLQENDRWEHPDVDYTPYKNILSATWPSLRHKNYTWAVIDAENLDAVSFYKDETDLQLADPCSHPDAIKCGQTEKEFVNVIFKTKEELKHGKRYLICIHAPPREIKYEKWTEKLAEVRSCSDGVTVDLTPPTPGSVWIGKGSGKNYESSTSDIFVSWDAFTDIEELRQLVHQSGIKEYYVGIGSTRGGTDVAPFTYVGIVNHYTFHGLHLQDGHEYYATVKAFDFSLRSAKSYSNPIKIDSTPPETSKQPIKINGRHLSKLNEINACWRDVFYDHESGIDYFLWSIGSHPGHDDIIPFTQTTLDCGISAEDINIDIHEGHAYFITVKAVNRAKLVTTASSWAYIYDMSPPLTGHVYDGRTEQMEFSSMKDIDYQTDTQQLHISWEGFHDPHSNIKTYYVNSGTCPDCEDVLINQEIGITNNFTLCHIHLGSGIRYFTTITACNTADLCTSVTSDGVVIDNSPPTQGNVQDGVDVHDTEYQSLRNYIAAKWYGFTDPQSGIDRYTWRIGTKQGLDDIVKAVHLPVTDLLVDPNLPHKLPVGKRIYVTIKAYNKAGLSTEATSNGFLIDESPPIIIDKPYVSRDLGSIKEDSIVFRSTFKVMWNVEDKESFIQRQYLSISSHTGGDFNATSTELNGIVREYTFARLDLHDGGTYSVKLIVCNGAKLCIEDETQGFLIDSSPPTPGMFAIRTDHAADLHRHVDGWMTWSAYKLWLSWLGFFDIHTGIETYFVSVGSQYMMDDLNKIEGMPQTLMHNQSGIDKDDEGYVQSFEIETKNLKNLEHVFVSVWAVNQVGLPSRMIHSQFKLVPGGSLELIRRCSSVTCLGHCVCAAQGKRCSLNQNACIDISKANTNSLLGVSDITDIQPNAAFIDVKYTSSNSGIAAKWHIIQAQGKRPVWYEWSAGLTSEDTPTGIFDNLFEEVWHHAGQTNQAVLNLKRGTFLKENPTSYSMFIRAWYDENTYADFKTDGVNVFSKPLALRKIGGAAVVEQIPGHWKKDIDYTKSGSPFTISWKGIFIGQNDMIDRFNVYLSTYPGSHDVHVVNLDLPGSANSYNISRVPLTPGIMYYSNVIGYSFSGIHETVTSDGLMIDSVSPTSGVIFDGIGLHDIEYQNNSYTVGASWDGFTDKDSGITHYMWCVETKPLRKQCNIRDWENVGIHRSVSRQLNNSIISTGSQLQSRVYAEDLIGQRSISMTSNGIMIDDTHPEPALLQHLDDNILGNPSFEEIDTDAVDWQNVSNINICTNVVLPLKWNATSRSCVTVLSSNRNVAMHGKSFLFVEGEIEQTVKVNVGQLYRITFYTAHPPILGSVLANKEGFVKIGNKKHVFIVYTKQDKHGRFSTNLDWHHHTFYFRAAFVLETITVASMTGNTGILFDDLKVQQTVLRPHDDKEAGGKHLHAHVVTLHQWSSIHASWSFMDPESPIVDYMWAIGYTEGSTEVQGFTSVGLSNFAFNYNVTLAHMSIVHITVVATNAAGLRCEAHAEDLLVDLTPPEILFLNDGIGSDIDAQTTEEISANWDVHDEESGLEVCEWAVGYQEYGNEIQSFQTLPHKQIKISKVFPSEQVSMQTVHVTIRCRNKAGLQSSLSSDGVKISNLAPQTTGAKVTILPHSLTEFNCRGVYQADMSKLRMKWNGFTDITGLDSYMLSLQNNDRSVDITKSIIAETQEMSYSIMYGLNMIEGNVTASVRAINRMYLRSIPVESDLVVSPPSPVVISNPSLSVSVLNRTVTASWKNQFSGQPPIFYEVSVGTTLGGSDIIQWQENKNDFLEFTILGERLNWICYNESLVAQRTNRFFEYAFQNIVCLSVSQYARLIIFIFLITYK